MLRSSNMGRTDQAHGPARFTADVSNLRTEGTKLEGLSGKTFTVFSLVHLVSRWESHSVVYLQLSVESGLYFCERCLTRWRGGHS